MQLIVRECPGCVGGTSFHEVMQLIILAWSKPLRHRLDSLAIARSDRPRNVERAHPPSALVAEAIQERLEPLLNLITPIRAAP